MDLLRFHKFTIGWSWKSEYGDPDDPEDVEFLLGYSPYHNITQGVEYPSVMISTVLFVCLSVLPDEPVKILLQVFAQEMWQIQKFERFPV